MRSLAWNVNKRKLGQRHLEVFRALDVDTILLNEFVDGKFRPEFTDDLREAGYGFQAMSEGVPGVRAPRIFAASRQRFEVGDLAAPEVDVWSTCNFLHIRFELLEMVGIRVPCYERSKKSEAVKIPDYWRRLGELFDRVRHRRILFAGDFNTDPKQIFGNREEKAVIENSLNRLTIPEPAGKWSFKRNGSSARIDYVAHTDGVTVSRPEYVAKIGDLVLAGEPGALSDHAGLLFEVGSKSLDD